MTETSAGDERTTSHRREFVRTLALIPAAGLLARPGLAVADDPKPSDEPAAKPADPESARVAAEVEARMQLILARYGNQLDADARAAVRSDVLAMVQRLRSLARFALDNSDEPMPRFVPYRGAIE